MEHRSERRGRMLVISGPSGSGKSSICRELLEDTNVVFSVSATTRSKRPGEVDGRDYRFVTTEEFRKLVESGAFIESAEVHGNMYGTLRADMERALGEGRVYLVEIDVQGANQLQRQGVPGTYVFIAPPDFETLRNRLEGRGTDAPEVIERRLKKAHDEYEERVKYDHVVVNDDFERTMAEVRRLACLAAPRTGSSPTDPSSPSNFGPRTSEKR
jgi:guanylate kinase